MRKNRQLFCSLAAVTVAVIVAGCATVVDRDTAPDSTVAVGDDPGGASERPETTASASRDPSPSASPEPDRAMRRGDCLYKVAVDDLGLPVPRYVDCADPHMFEVTGIVEASKGDADFDFEAIDDARKARCRAEYESYTGLDTREVGNAFGWDQLTEEAWQAGETGYPCYATAPGFADMTGSIAR